MFARLTIVVGLLVTLLLVASTAARAQGPNDKWVTIKGKVAAIGAGQISVVDDQNKPLAIIAPGKKAQFSVNGAAVPEFLTAGVFVQFTGMFNQKKEATEPVKELMVCEISDLYQPGFVPEGGPDAVIAYKKNPDAPIKCLVRGSIKTNKNGELQVNTLKETVKIKLADNAKITVSVTNPALVKKGDLVDASGYERMPGVPGSSPSRVEGMRVVITAANPFGSKVVPKAATPPAKPATPATPPKK